MNIERSLLRVFLWPVHRLTYRLSGGRVGMQEPSAKRLGILFLTTTGRKSGEKRTVPTFFMRDRDALVVVPSNAGDPRDPAWYLNLQANPEAEIRTPVGGQQTVRARNASAEERARLWPELVRLNPGYARYEKRRMREIPVVVLESVTK